MRQRKYAFDISKNDGVRVPCVSINKSIHDIGISVSRTTNVLEYKVSFARAIRDHLLCQDRLGRIISLAENVGGYSVAEIDKDHCELGLWLQDHAGDLHLSGSYRKLVEAHARFHRIASEILAQLRIHDPSGVREDISEGALVLASVDTVRAIIDLKNYLDGYRYR